MTEEHDTEVQVTRRAALRRLVFGSGLVVAGAVVGGTAAAAAPAEAAGDVRASRSTSPVSATPGGTRRPTGPPTRATSGGFPSPSRAGSIPRTTSRTPGDGFVPTQDGSIGRWLCRGSMLVYAERLEPHVQTTQEFIFGTILGDRLFADDTITTAGNEGTFETHQWLAARIAGGTGIYMGAIGEEFQDWNGFNTSLNSDGTGNAPNFRMRFDLLLPDL